MPRRATPYRLGSEEQHLAVKSAPYKDLRFLTGAGSVFATAEDLVALVAAIQRGTLGEEARARIVGGDPTGWRGWTGRTNGYEASVDFLPAEGLTFVFLSDLQSASNWQVREQVKRILEGQAPHLVPIPPPVRASSDRPESLVGVFGPATITLVDGKHFRGDNEFYATDRGEYYIPASGTTMRFRRDSSGFVDAIVSMSPGGTQTVLPRSAGQ